MKQEALFGNAKWVCAGDPEKSDYAFPILRSTFVCEGLEQVKKATLRVIGLGFFQCRMNGQTVTDQVFLPLSTDYEPHEIYAENEVLTGHRIYVPTFDVTAYMVEGRNVLTVHFGGGWYTYRDSYYGEPKVIYQLTVETDCGETEFVSSEKDKIGSSFVCGYCFNRYEEHDYLAFDDAVHSPRFDDTLWQNAVPARPLDTEYAVTDCPADKVMNVFFPTISNKQGDKVSYDCGQNLSGYPVLRIKAERGAKIEVYFSEEKLADGAPDPAFNHDQCFTVISDGTERLVHPEFTWFAFRYFTVTGAAEVEEVRFIHSDIAVTSEFTSDNETLNWIYRAYLNTQLCNMHAGIPSDCPHLERRGYTGDGQLTCHAAMNTIDAKAFYRKWIGDIADCQDIYSGHVQYTAPYLRSGGGPGGWGCAMIEVPYMYYRHYGDTAPLFALYRQMLRYFDFLEAHSRGNLVVSDIPKEWCLGDWCAPIQVILPAPFVNTYFYVKSLYRMKEIAEIIGRTCDIPMLEKRISDRKQAMTDAYFNTWDGNFIGCMQGANAFAVDIGIGNEKTYAQLVKYYKALGRFDTGIFGTDVVTRVLFEHGDGALAVELLTSTAPISFEGMRRAGATTLWENWPHATWDRSRNHPMFGAVAAYLFDYLLGIRQADGSCGYDNLVIEPVMVEKLNRVSGKRTVPKGEVSVAYEKMDGEITFRVVIPEGTKAVFRVRGEAAALSCGVTTLKLSQTELRMV